MFPRPIEQAPKHRRLIYQVMLPVSLCIWLLPLLAAAASCGGLASDSEVAGAELAEQSAAGGAGA